MQELEAYLEATSRPDEELTLARVRSLAWSLFLSFGVGDAAKVLLYLALSPQVLRRTFPPGSVGARVAIALLRLIGEADKAEAFESKGVVTRRLPRDRRPLASRERRHRQVCSYLLEREGGTLALGGPGAASGAASRGGAPAPAKKSAVATSGRRRLVGAGADRTVVAGGGPRLFSTGL